MIVTEPLLCCPDSVFNYCHAGKPRDFSAQNLTIQGHIQSSLTQRSCPVPLAEKQPQSIMFQLQYFTVDMVSLGCNSVFLFLQTTGWVYAKKVCFGFIRLNDILQILFWIIHMLSGKLQMGLDSGHVVAKAGGHQWQCKICCSMKVIHQVSCVVLGLLLIFLTPWDKILDRSLHQ